MERRNGARGDGEAAREAVPPAVRTLFVLLAAESLVTNYASTAMNVALSALIGDLDTSLTGVQSAIALYALVVAAFLITGSKLGARHGNRRVFLLGCGFFALGALVTAFGPTLPFMLVGWSLLQGIGVALILPTTVSMLTAAFTGAARTRALSALGTVAGIGATAGPVVGGLVTRYPGWRASFLMEAAATLVVVLLVRRTADPERPPARAEEPFDVPGAVLSAAGFGLLVVATLLAGRYGLLVARQDFEVFGRTLLHRGGLSPVVVLAAVGPAVLVAFAGRERRLVRSGGDPLVRVSVLRNRTVRAGTLSQVMQFLVPTGALFLVPVFLQTTFGLDALSSGVVMIPVALGLTVAASTAARLIGRGRMSHRSAQMGAFVFMGAGCIAIAALFDPHERQIGAVGLALAPGLLLIGIGRGLATTVTDLIQSAPPPEEVSDVTGLSRTAGYLGGSFGTALVGALMTTALLLAFEAGTDGSSVLSPGQKQLVDRTIEQQVQVTAASDEAVRAKLASRGVTGAAADEIVRINARARGRALAVAATGMAVMALAGFLVARRLPRERSPGPPAD
ncbi:MFS transporter [Streptomyces sp. NPDC059506]|uniref:MFS transporter n=1 Tax=Streptomyces sp. NPDC059506 TaxID=3347751 RepID=UPI0036AB4AD5